MNKNNMTKLYQTLIAVLVFGSLVFLTYLVDHREEYFCKVYGDQRILNIWSRCEWYYEAVHGEARHDLK